MFFVFTDDEIREDFDSSRTNISPQNPSQTTSKRILGSIDILDFWTISA
jgi:hypothetical protein